MKLPAPVRAGVEAALRSRGSPAAVEAAEAVGGGCVSPAARLRTTGGDLFLKWGGPGLPAGLLPAEVRGLARLAAAGAVRVPEVIAASAPDDEGPEWLLLEWLPPGGATPASWRRLGRELAALHRTRDDRFGAPGPNFIGSLPQDNTRSGDWPSFWRERRLEPQLRRAVDEGRLGEPDRRRMDALFREIDGLLAPAAADGASLLHGDLWGGNVHMMSDGTPALIDPSVYHGHREVDLAMAELFGGFGAGFRAAYEEAWPLQPGYAPVRRAIYQLYYLLVHVNLFGSGYVGGTRAALSDAGF